MPPTCRAGASTAAYQGLPLSCGGSTETASYRARATGRSSDSQACRSSSGRLFYLPSLPSLATSADDGFRSCIPLRDSPGFTPGSLFHPPPTMGGETDCEEAHTPNARRDARATLTHAGKRGFCRERFPSMANPPSFLDPEAISAFSDGARQAVYQAIFL